MFGYKYKEDALKWRAHQKAADEEFLKGRAKCKVTVHLVGGDSVYYTNEASASFQDVGFLDPVMIRKTAAKELRTMFFKDIENTIKYGATIDNNHYMPHTIMRLEIGEIEEYTE